MEQQKQSGCLGILASVWRGFDLATRIIFNIIVLTLVFALLALLGGDVPAVPDQAALVLTPRGDVVEQLAGDPVQRALDKLNGTGTVETLWRDLDDAIRSAKGDDRIQALLLDLNQMGGAGLSKLQGLRAAIEDFKESGKPVIAAADFYSKESYYLASVADEVYLHHMGMVVLDGYGRYRTYYREALDRLEIDWHIFRIGEYKTAVEPYLFNDMSEAARTVNMDWLDDLWRAYLADVAEARGLSTEELSGAIDGFIGLLGEADGQPAEVARAVGLVDHLSSRDEIRQRMIELVGADSETRSFQQIGHDSYLEALGDDDSSWLGLGDSDTVAVVVAKGTILDGHQPPGTIGGDSTAAIIRDARQDDNVKALVLRVDSGGGSAFASEVIRRELVLAREAGKKVVVSMGSVAASGGYWISTASDEIWASPNTITGSIGIYSMFPTFEKPLAKHLGVRVDGVGTTWLSGAFRPERELGDREAELMRSLMSRGYQDFLTRVAEARGITPDEVDQIGRGRVWSGFDAHHEGLVDHLGGLEQAIDSAAELAGLGDDYRVDYLEGELDWTDQLMADLLARSVDWFGPAGSAALAGGLRQAPVHEAFFELFRRQAEMLSSFNDPNGLYALCFCEVD